LQCSSTTVCNALLLQFAMLFYYSLQCTQVLANGKSALLFRIGGSSFAHPLLIL
jgi:hypothetical protein